MLRNAYTDGPELASHRHRSVEMGAQSVSQLKVTLEFPLDEGFDFSFASSLWDKALL